MNFELTEEQKLIRDMVRSFAEAEVAPSARIRDEEERFDRALMYDRLGELGLTGIVFPEEYGGDDWILSGSKIFITNGGEAETYVVLARSDKSAEKHRGISAYIVEKGTPGFSFGKKEAKMGIRSSPTMELVFENCRIPGANLLGKEGQGFKVAMKTLDGGRIGIAAQALGIAQGAFDAALAYTREREQFNQRIASFQGVSFQLADMATQIEAARLLIYNAAYRASAGLSYSQESAMAKLFASETAMKVTTQAVQLFGGYGYTREFPVERMMRDAKITEIYEGTSEIQRVVIGAALTR
jgi:alkylation response protein AidB-like acyl-CoA dehydrogenase